MDNYRKMKKKLTSEILNELIDNMEKNYWINLYCGFKGDNMVDVVGAPIVLSIRCVCQQRGKSYNWLFLSLGINCK